MSAAGSAPLPGSTTPAVAPPSGDRPTCPATLAVLRLLIHATAGVSRHRGRISEALRRWRSWALQVTRGQPPVPLRLQIADLQGRLLFVADDLQALIEVPLPAGTYHITVSDGGRQRRYTVALEQGATFNLHLHGAPAAR